MRRDDYLHQQAWNYFALHAQQRLTTVNFYLVVATALTAAAVASFGENFAFPCVRLAAGLLLSLLSFAFWRLDFRNRELIKAAEAALRALEASSRSIDYGTGEPPLEWLFTREHRQSAERKGAAGWTRYVVPRTYSHVFNVLFGSFLVAGFLIAVLAVR